MHIRSTAAIPAFFALLSHSPGHEILKLANLMTLSLSFLWIGFRFSNLLELTSSEILWFYFRVTTANAIHCQACRSWCFKLNACSCRDKDAQKSCEGKSSRAPMSFSDTGQPAAGRCQMPRFVLALIPAALAYAQAFSCRTEAEYMRKQWDAGQICCLVLPEVTRTSQEETRYFLNSFFSKVPCKYGPLPLISTVHNLNTESKGIIHLHTVSADSVTAGQIRCI